MVKCFSKLIAAAWLICFTGFYGTAHAAEKPSKEYLVKAAFLYNFTKFVDWPEETSELNICLFGKDKFGGAIDAIEKKSSAQRRYVILRNPSNAMRCHIAYLSPAGKKQEKSLLKAMRAKPILTVGDKESFVGMGGVVSFVMVDNKIKLVVNLPAAQKAGLRVDSQLLEVALKVIERE